MNVDVVVLPATPNACMASMNYLTTGVSFGATDLNNR